MSRRTILNKLKKDILQIASNPVNLKRTGMALIDYHIYTLCVKELMNEGKSITCNKIIADRFKNAGCIVREFGYIDYLITV